MRQQHYRQLPDEELEKLLTIARKRMEISKVSVRNFILSVTAFLGLLSAIVFSVSQNVPGTIILGMALVIPISAFASSAISNHRKWKKLFDDASFEHEYRMNVKNLKKKLEQQS